MHPTRWELSHMVDLQAAANSLVIWSSVMHLSGFISILHDVSGVFSL